jgi:serine phosphatase RsbU (regulator of sigma subunit)
MSDGIAEAMDASGRLFGFERVHELAAHGEFCEPKLPSAAQTFGQEDDISVISVSRTVVPEPVAT